MFFKTKRKTRFFHLLKITAVFCFCITAVILFTQTSSAQVNLNVNQIAQDAGLSNISMQKLIANIIKWVLALLGLVLLIIIMIAGFRWMTSGGDNSKIQKAKQMLVQAVIGFAIILASYVIVSLIMGSFALITNGGGNGTNPPGGGGDLGGGFGDGALGGGVIENHFPARGARNVPRNTLIMITLKVPVATSSVINGEFNNSGAEAIGYGFCNSYTNNNTNGNACGKLSNGIDILDQSKQPTNKLDSNEVVAVLSADGKNIILDPINNLGNDKTNTDVEVLLKQSMKTSENKTLFNNLSNGYSWRFQVSTILDTTPPSVSVWPRNGDDNIARNAIIQMNFSEPINLFSANNNTVVIKVGTETISGTLRVSNQFKTVEFISNMSCSSSGSATLNSCGEQVFCLPGASTINALLKSASTGANVLSGISDAAGNFLDGNNDNTPGDDYSWSFKTNSNVDITAPVIDSVTPETGSTNNLITTNISAKFTKRISPSSVNTNSFYIYKAISECNLSANLKSEISTTTANKCFPNYGVYISGSNNDIVNMQIHSPFLESGGYDYRPRLTSSIKDSYGNCFYPSRGPGGTGQQ